MLTSPKFSLSVPRARRVALASIAVALVAAACSSSSESEPSQTSTTAPDPPVAYAAAGAVTEVADGPKPVVVDTDLGPDDVMALLFLFESPRVDVVAITVAGTGIVHCEPGVRHVNDLLALAGASGVPVACGRETPLQGDRAFPAALRADADRLFGVSLPEGRGEATQLGAVELMASVLESSPEPVTLLSLGPPTNVAGLLQTTPEALAKIDLIYASGGALESRGKAASSGSGPAEWNFYVDPEAARAVLNSGALVTLVPREAADDLPVTPELAAGLGDPASSPAVGVIAAMIEGNPALSGPDFFMWDLLTAAVFADEALAVFEMSRVALAGAPGQESGVIATSVDDGARIRVAVSAVRDRFEAVLLATLDAEGAGTSDDIDTTDTVEVYGDVVWEFSLDGSFDDITFSHWSAAVDGGVVYFGGSNGTVYALDSESGAVIWELAVGEEPVPPEGVEVPADFRFGVNGPMALSDRAVVFKVRGDPEGLGTILMAVDREMGGELWRFVPPEGETRVRGPAIADGVVFTGTTEFLYALDSETGAELWRFRPEGGAPDPAARVTVADGVVYFGTPAGLLYAVDIDTHQELWSFQTGFGTNGVASRPVVVDGITYFGADDATFYAVDAVSGEELWRFIAPGSLPSSPTVAGGQVVFGSLGVGVGGLIALEMETGEEVWRATSGNIISSPTVADGAVYVGSGDGNLYVVDVVSGAVLWRFRTENPVGSSPVVVDGVVYFQSGLSFYAVRAPT